MIDSNYFTDVFYGDLWYAMEAIERPDTWILKNAFYDRLCDSLSKSTNQKMLFAHIAKYRDKHIEVLSNPYIFDIMGFNLQGEDGQVLFRACGIIEEEVKPVLKETMKAVKLDKTGSTSGDAANIIPFRVILIMAMAYFWDDKPKLHTLWLYYAYSFYYSVFTVYFQRAANINRECMIYTINNMSNKFDIKKYGSLEGMLDSTMAVAIESYSQLFKTLSDMDIINLINAFKTRVSHKMFSIRNAYEESYRRGDRVFTSVERDAEGNFIERDTNLSIIDNLANEYTTIFFNKSLNYKNIHLSSRLHEVSENELRTALVQLHDGKYQSEVRTFYNALFQSFFKEYPNASITDISSNKFLVAADAIYKKGNSRDVNIIKIKDLTHTWLERSSNTYRSINQPDTKNKYRKAIFMYFAFCVSSKQ